MSDSEPDQTGHCVLCTPAAHGNRDEHDTVTIAVEVEALNDVLEGDVRVCKQHLGAIRRCLIAQSDEYEYPEDDPGTVLPDGGRVVEPESPSAGYVDIREIHPAYREEECWNCGHTRFVRRRWRVCKECFMGQQKHDGEYTDYRELWYGDVSIGEAKRRYAETEEEMEKHRQHTVEVRI